MFDSRAFNIPVDEVVNYFIWRQNDCVRNSVSGLAQAHFSPKELNGKSQSDMHEMLHSIGMNWADLPSKWKNGQVIYKTSQEWQIGDAPQFTTSRESIELLLGRDD